MTATAVAISANAYCPKAALAAAEELIPILISRTGQTEEGRRIPVDTVRDLKASKLLRLLQPAQFGGGEADYGLLLQVLVRLAKGCISTAWVGFNAASHAWMLGMWPQEAQKMVWGEDPDAIISSSLVYPAGQAKEVEGGYLISGAWPFSSGVDASDYLMLGAMVAKDDGPPQKVIALTRTSDLKIIDTWQVSGLCGTGSKNLEGKDLFVPSHCVVDAESLSDGTAPGLQVNSAAVYRVPVLGVFPHLVTAAILGNAAGAYDEFLASFAKRKTTYSKLEPRLLVGTQMRVAEAGALIAAGQALMLEDAEEAMDTARSGQIATREQKLRWRRNATYAAGFGTKAVDILFSGAGGGGNYLSNPAQRRFRDAHAAVSHIQTSWDVNGAEYGLLALS